MQIYQVSRQFPKAELYSLTDRIRRSSRSVCTNLAEVWRKKRYRAAFIAKLNAAEAAAAETLTWPDFAYSCRQLERVIHNSLAAAGKVIPGKIVRLIPNPNPRIIAHR